MLEVTCVPQRGGEDLYRLNPHDEPPDIAGGLGGDGEADQEPGQVGAVDHEDGEEERECGQHHAQHVHPPPAELV